MSAGINSVGQSGDAAERERQQRTSPSQPQARLTNGYAPAPASALPSTTTYRHSSSYQSSYAPNVLPTRDPGSGPNRDGHSLPSIAELVGGTPNGSFPSAGAQAPVSSGPGPPTSFPTTSFASRPDIPAFSDPVRPPLHTRAPPPAPLNLQNGVNGHSTEYRRDSDPRQAAEAAHHHSGLPNGHSGGPNGYGPPQPLPPPSGPPSSGPYPPGQFPLPIIATPLSPRQSSSRLPSPYGTHNPPPAYGHAQAVPGQERYETTVDRAFGNWDYGEALERVSLPSTRLCQRVRTNQVEKIKTYSQSIAHFADTYLGMAREQNGGQPIPSRLPTEAEFRNLNDHTYIIQNCLKDIRSMVLETQAHSERAVGPVRDNKEQDMVVYEPHPLQIQQMQVQQLQHHTMQQQQQLQQQMAPQHQGYALTEHKPNGSNKRRGVSQEPPSRSNAPRYADAPRKRAAPPGRCHSCNRVDTPEWRRGPDGARTLCNACGLHYAKLERKKLTELKSIRPKPGNDSGPG